MSGLALPPMAAPNQVIENEKPGEGHVDLSAEADEDLGLRPLRWSIVGVGIVATAAAFTDAASMGGLAVLLASGLTDVPDSAAGIANKFANPWVILSLIVVSFLLSAVVFVIREHITARWDADRRLDLIHDFRDADFATQTEYSGAKLGVVTEQITRASSGIAGLAGLINNSVRTVIYMAVAFLASWQVSTIAVVAGGGLVLALRMLSKRTRVMHRKISGQSIDIGGQIGEMAAANRELHLLNRWEEIVSYLREEIERLRDLRAKSSTLAGLVGPVYQAGTLMVALAIGILAKYSGGGPDAIQKLATSALLLIRALTAAQTAQVNYQQYNDTRPYLDRVASVIMMLRRHRRATGDQVPAAPVELSAEHVDLSHGNDVIVRDLNLHLSGPGGVALIGPSGSGKSTTTAALAGLLEPRGGSIAASGVPLNIIPGPELGHVVGMLPQDPRLLHASLRSNIVRDGVDASDDDVFRALDAVRLTETVNGFGKGLDTAMGREGEGFSGGELQRLGLARLMVNQPDVWLLDEPTSALDKTNSDLAAKIITDAMQDHLVVVVTHRPDLLHHCGRVIYMEAGQVVDDGTLAEVAGRQPFVAAMIHSGAPEPSPSAAPADR